MSDVRKLPKWAQRKIENLERDLAELEAQRAKRFTSDAESNVVIDPYMARIPLPLNVHVAFALPSAHQDGSKTNLHVHHDRCGSVLRVMADGAERLIVRPEASNVVSLALERL